MSTFGRLLTKRDFWPLFGAQALGAFNDNFFRSAIIAFVAFNAAYGSGAEKTILGALATGLMMLPFFLFSAPAGQWADRVRKSKLVKLTKAWELGVMLLAAWFFYLEEVEALLVILFLMGTQSAFFGPLKYGLLPEILEERDLVAGNGLVEAVTFLAIVLGTLAGSWLVTRPAGTAMYLPFGLVLVAAAGLAMALRQPDSEPGDPELKVETHIWRSTWELIGAVKRRPGMWLTVLAISWFWAMGAILITQIPVLCGTVMNATPAVGTLLMTLATLGVGVGSIGVQWLLKGQVSARLVPASAGLTTLFLFGLAASVATLPAAPFGVEMPKVTLEYFLTHWTYQRLGLCCLLVTITAGVLVVPLNALLQHLSEPHERARVIAANNIVNSLAIVLGSLVVMLITTLGFGLAHVFIFVALTGVLVSVLSIYFVPDEGLRVLLGWLLKILYRPKVKGLEHFAALKDGPALVVANHTSFIDVVLLVVFLPRQLTFAIDSFWALTWWLRPLLRTYKALPVNPTQPLATRGLIEALNNGEVVVIFPEGRITTTGSLMKIYDGSGLIAGKTKAPIVPVVIGGAQHTRFGRLQALFHKPARVPVTLTVMPPATLQVANVSGEKQRDQRRRAADALYDLMSHSLFTTLNHRRNLWPAFLDAARYYGPKRRIMEDIQRKPVTYRGLIARARLLGRRLAGQTRPGEMVGLLLPNSIGLVSAMFGLWSEGRTAVMLNPTQGPGPLTSALETAQVKTVVTSRAFLEKTGLGALVEKLPVRLFILEDQRFTRWEKLAALCPVGHPAASDTPAVVVFTSGSEGKPKGVALSHQNLLSNVHQLRCRLQVTEDDIMFNALPMFHAFGLAVGAMFPLYMGMRCFNYVSPLHTHEIPELIYDTRATIACASDTFASAWGRNAHPYDFTSLRIMIVGAEKVKPKTRALYSEKFGLRIFEGYGVSETSPVLSINSHLHCRAGSVGRLLPDIEGRIDPVEGVERGGKLVVRGPNVMLGYIRPEQPGVIQPPEGGWHDTGDIVEIDEDGFIWIKGRFKRFAKIGGEMVSLAAIEEVATALWPGRPQVLIALEDETKGEKLALVTEEPAPDLPRLWQAQKEAGLPELTYPRQFIYLPEIPMTPLGKVNMPKLMEMALTAAASSGR